MSKYTINLVEDEGQVHTVTSENLRSATQFCMLLVNGRSPFDEAQVIDELSREVRHLKRHPHTRRRLGVPKSADGQ